MRVALEAVAVLPHSLVELAPSAITGDLVAGVAQGALPATVTIETATDAGLGDVAPYIMEIWQERLAQSPQPLKEARERLDQAEVDESDRITAPFLWWSAGTAKADVRAWFESIAPVKGKKGK
jgi:hypothetical protein